MARRNNFLLEISKYAGGPLAVETGRIPILFGAEGKRFIEKAKRKPQPLPREELERINANYEMIKANTEKWQKIREERWAREELAKKTNA